MSSIWLAQPAVRNEFPWSLKRGKLLPMLGIPKVLKGIYRLLAFGVVLGLGVDAFGQARQLPAFPGADGPAKYASGGRGGVVYRVTKLNSAIDDPERNTPGTLWYGLTQISGPRIIVFDVAGVFHLGKMDTTNWTSGGNAWDANSRQSISGSDITIAGETAPGPVIIMGGSLKPSGSNIIIRNIIFAPGYGMRAFWEPDRGTNPPSPGTLPTAYTMDALDISGQNILIDHCDAYFATDETISINERATNVTIQYCICALAQNYNQHSYAHLLGGNTDAKAALIHNLEAHIRGRIPRVGAEVGLGALNDFRNNVIYNWLGTAGYSGGSQPSKNNFIHNFYLAGPGGDSDWDSTESGGTGIFSGSSGYTYAFVSGNLRDTNKDGDPNDAVSADGSFSGIVAQAAAYDIDMGVMLAARDAFTNVLRYAGARWWERDYDFVRGNTNAIDSIAERVVHDVVTGRGRIQAWADDPYNASGTYQVLGPKEGAEWRALWALRPINGVPPFKRPSGWDTDGDGIPDYWELAHGLNPNVPNNNGDFDNDGYTDIEEYLHYVAAWPAPGVIHFTGEENSRYARIFNWRVYGIQLPITNKGTVTTFSYWQPSRYDTVLISNKTAVVDSVGQYAGSVLLRSGAKLEITNGWLSVTKNLEIDTNSSLVLLGNGGLRLTNHLINHGMLQLRGNAGLSVGGWITNFGTIDALMWEGTLPSNIVNRGVILSRGDSWNAFLKVDINNNNRPVSEGLQPGYTPWSSNAVWFSGGDVISNTFSGITIVFSRVGPIGTGLQPGYWKEGVQSTDYDIKLVSDGIKVQEGDAGGQIQMRISGLTPGTYVLVSYHNDWDNHATATVAPLKIYLNGALAIPGLAQTVRVTNNALAAKAYLNFDVQSGQDVVILFEADTNSFATIKNVYINGFEIAKISAAAQLQRPQLGIRREDERLYIEILGDIGQTNTLQVSYDLIQWIDLTNIVCAGPIHVLELGPIAPSNHAFFRTVVR